jgi:uncharacterized membrane protein
MSKGLALIAAFVALLISASAYAKPEYLDVLTETFKADSAKLSEKSCANCHVSDSDYAKNPYGKRIAAEMLAANTKELTPAILNKVGEPGSASAAEPSGATASEPPAEKKPKPLIPKNAFHPAIVHFPIALFMAGLFLDALGMWKKHNTLLLAGWYNLVLGAVSTLASLASGLAAMTIMHLPFKGLIFNHLVLACIGTAIMWGMVALRYKRHDKMSTGLRAVYYVLAVTGCILIAYSAHLGGDFVYGT